MMDPIEFEGKTVDEAIAKACEHFGVPREKLSIDIISEGSVGFLGLGAKKARIRAGLLTLSLAEDLFEGEEEAVRPEMPREQKREDDAARRAKELLEGLLDRMHLPAQVNVREEEDRIVLDVKGDGGGLLIGKKGQNLDAIQHIVNKAINRQGNGKKMIVIDVESYRKRREEALVTLAHRLAQQVKKTKKKVTVGNMNAHDRRIIHLALQGDSSLTTKSRGEGELRKIVIMPVGKSQAKGEGRKEPPRE
ncbi:MAG TPA: RNA-binding cell elongation regulator Jag/EloR [Syntrophales bacterium]|nr:RNA-binding cell elongation regulator Jag/EloR [Syntrophales bacterium]HOL58278.1 RNA-binding cell elongation regulator Jag/EloR [Syntrophales bacterium]HPO34447.1 RNA-binding cell elongation regulator Jag/EloR [Syntrophales bacterium]